MNGKVTWKATNLIGEFDKSNAPRLTIELLWDPYAFYLTIFGESLFQICLRGIPVEI